MKEKDYVFISVKKGKADESGEQKEVPTLFRIVEVRGDRLVVRLEDNCNIVEKVVNVEKSSVMLNLGDKPVPGKVYNYDLNSLYRGAFDSALGDIHIFGPRPSKEQRAGFLKAAESATRTLAKRKLSKLLDPILFEIRPAKGKYSGCYLPTKDADKKPAIVQFYIDATDQYEYLIYHELGHAFERQALVNYPRLMASWIRVHALSVHPEFVSVETITSMQKVLESKSVSTLADWAAHFTDDKEKQEFLALMRWMKQHRAIGREQLKTLIESDQKDRVVELFPSKMIETRHEIKNVISEYAAVNVHETIAEAFAMHMIGTKLPAKVEELLSKSIGVVQNHLAK